MSEDAGIFQHAVRLVLSGEPELFSVIGLSLQVSITATLLAGLIGGPLGLLLAIMRFRGRKACIVSINALLGLPPVVVGLVVYLLLSRMGPLGALGLLFTPTGMILAQFVLTLPIIVALTHRAIEMPWHEFGDALTMDGASRWRQGLTLASIARPGLVTAFLTAFGRAIAEVGAIIIVGGNIRNVTRTMTTSIALETSKGDLGLALALGIILVSISFAVSALAFLTARVLTDEK